MHDQTEIRLYIAVSLDGLIASRDGGIDWLDPFSAEDVGFERFLRDVGTIVMGRRTYDQILGFGSWPYPGKRTVVLTSRPLPPGGPAAETWVGKPGDLASSLRAESTGDVWLVGGARTAQAFLAANLVDRLEIHVVPLILGRGIRLFAPVAERRPLVLDDTVAYDNGIVRLTYVVAGGAGSA